MLGLLIVLSLSAPVPELNEMDQELISIIAAEVQRLKELERLPVCPIEPGTYWNLECA